MSKFAQQLKNKAGEIRLRTDEREQLRDRLLAYMEYHPLPNGQHLPKLRGAKRSSFYSRLSSGWFMGRAAGVAAVFFILVVPAMAEKSLPGDVLYPVKVRFNEEVRGALVSSPYKKIEWETERLERRVAEAQLLADSGRLTASAEANMAKSIKQHSDAAKESIDSIRVNDREEAALAEITLASALDVSTEVLAKGNSEATSTSVIASAVSQARASVTASGEVASYHRLMSRIESETAKAYEYLGGLDGTVNEKNKADIERRLQDVKVKVDTAVALQSSDEPAAVAILTEVLGSTRKVISFITNLDVRNSVAIEQLVPATPTPEERKVNLTNRLEIATKLSAGLTADIGKLSTTSAKYKEVNEILLQVKDSEKRATEALKTDNLTEAENIIKEVTILLDNLSSSLKSANINTQATTTTTSTTSINLFRFR